VALFDAKQRVKAEKAILKALRLQVENKGFAFVEVLSECPLHLGVTPLEAEKWVREQMLPVFPLGVKKDVAAEPWPAWTRPAFDPERVAQVIGADEGRAAASGAAFPAERFGADVGLKLAGAGGDGAQTAAMLITRTAIQQGFDSTHIPSYGPESRGGTSYADVRLAESEVLSPAVPNPHVLVAFNAPSLTKFAPAVVRGGIVIYDSSVAPAPPPLQAGVEVLPVPFAEIAKDVGRLLIKNVVALGALQGATGLFPDEAYLAALRLALKDKAAVLPMNEQAFARGREAVRALRAESKAS
jgi:2-oxoisovalerate ferredoxin oxidoreductase beta subunit